jgi:hypothetical protein
MVEYDVAVHHDLDAMAAEALRCGIDLIGFPNRGAIEDWHWTRTLEGLWPRDEIQRRLLCISGFSERAVAYLMAKRRECAARFLRGEFPFWPFCEGFVPTALHEAGFTLESLARFGSVDCYRWGPPYHESELPAMMDQAFVHPVLTGHRYATSVLRIPKLAEIYLADPESRPRLELAPTKTVFPASRSKLAANRGLQTWLRRRLDLEPPEVVLPALAAALVRDGSSEALAALHQALAERGRDDLSVGSETNCSASRH